MEEEIIVEKGAVIENYALVVWEDDHIAGHLLSKKYFPAFVGLPPAAAEDETASTTPS